MTKKMHIMEGFGDMEKFWKSIWVEVSKKQGKTEEEKGDVNGDTFKRKKFLVVGMTRVWKFSTVLDLLLFLVYDWSLKRRGKTNKGSSIRKKILFSLTTTKVSQ